MFFLRLNQFGYKLSSPLVPAVSQQARVISTLCEMMCFLFHCCSVCVCVCVSIRCSAESEHLGLVGEDAKRIGEDVSILRGVYFLSVLVDVICPNVETHTVEFPEA